MLGIETNSKRIFGLDLLRVFAIFFVIHGHGAFLLTNTSLSFTANIPLPDVVDIFFVLTGFLIGSAFIAYSEKNTHVDFRKTIRFYGRTALRILPNYYFILILYYVLVKWDIVNGDLIKFPMWKFATFSQNLVSPFYDFFWESWCLPVQWWFYIIFPLLLALFSRHFSMRWIVPVMCMFFIVLSIVFRISISANAADGFWWDVWIRKTVLSRCDCIFVGVFASWIRVYFPDFWNRHAVKILVAGLILLLCIILIPRPIGSVYRNVVYFSMQSVAIAMLLPMATRVQSNRTFCGRVITHVSVLSYAMYLTNLMVVQIISKNYSDIFDGLGICGYGLYWLIIIVASYLLYILVEKPFAKIRSRI